MTRTMKKRAGCGGWRQPATTSTRPRYHNPYVPVNPHRQVFCGRPPQRPREPRPGGSCYGAALALLMSLLALQAGTLAAHQRAKAWAYVESWTREITTAKHTERLA